MLLKYRKWVFCMPVLMIFACQSEAVRDFTEKEVDTVESLDEEAYKNYREFSFAEFGLPIAMMVPNIRGRDNQLIPPIVEYAEGELTWQVQISKAFHLVIDEWGIGEIEIDQIRKEHASDVYKYNYVDSSAHHLIFTRSLTDISESEDYHFYMLKEVAGLCYSIKTSPEWNFDRHVVDMMYLSANSAELIEARSAELPQ